MYVDGKTKPDRRAIIKNIEGKTTVQSNVTARIKNLEEEFGAPLFSRSPRKVELTSAGEKLMTYCKVIDHLLEEAKEQGCVFRVRLESWLSSKGIIQYKSIVLNSRALAAFIELHKLKAKRQGPGSRQGTGRAKDGTCWVAYSGCPVAA